MKTVLIAMLWVTATVPPLAALTIVPKPGTTIEAPDEDVAELDSAQGNYDNVADQVHSRIIEVTNDTITDHNLIRIHWTVNSEVWIWAFKLRFTYFDENHNPFLTETRWLYSPNQDGSYNPVPPHSPIENWHELTVPTDQANKFKAVSVLVETAYQPD
jgi:hypothetical protein